MFYLINFLHGVFGMLKGIESGHTSENHSAMIIKYQSKVYRVDFAELDESEVEEALEHLKY